MKRVWLLATVIALAFTVNASAISVADINLTGGTGANACPAPFTAAGCIRFGDKIFRGISVGGAASAGGVDVTGSQVGDTVFVNFSGAFIDSAGGGATDYTIFYNVTSLIGASIGGISQSFSGDFSTGTGFFNFKEDVFSDQALADKVANSQVGCVFTTVATCDNADPAPEGGIQADDLLIAPPLPRVWVTKDFLVSAETGSLGASIIRQGFVQVPEPGQTALLLGGLLAIGLYFKSRKRAEA